MLNTIQLQTFVEVNMSFYWPGFIWFIWINIYNVYAYWGRCYIV